MGGRPLGAELFFRSIRSMSGRMEGKECALSTDYVRFAQRLLREPRSGLNGLEMDSNEYNPLNPFKKSVDSGRKGRKGWKGRKGKKTRWKVKSRERSPTFPFPLSPFRRGS